jgi:F420-non-reducing hydrogenase iron-sulfur subunit
MEAFLLENFSVHALFGFMSDTHKPEIIAFVCHWCAYAAADLAGISRIQYPVNVRLVRVMCTGRINSGFLLNAFAHGAHGVMVSG